MYAHSGSSLSLRSSHSHLHVSCALWALLVISSTSPSLHLLPHHLSYHFAVLAARHAENDSSTGYEPTEAYVEYTQESSGEQRIRDDFDYDDVTIGQTLLDACRRRADHSEEEGLSSCLSSSVSHDGTVKACCLPTSVERSRNSETQLRKWAD